METKVDNAIKVIRNGEVYVFPLEECDVAKAHTTVKRFYESLRYPRSRLRIIDANNNS